MTTTGGVHEADVLVVALGADYDFDATPGLAEGGNEFYSVRGAERLREVLPSFTRGRAVVGICGAPFKCPPAPSEAALLLHDHLVERGIRRRLRDLAGDAVRHAGPTFAGHLGGAAGCVRGAWDRVRRGPAGGLARPGAPRRRPRRRHGAAVRPLPRRPEAPRARRRPRERAGGGRLHPRRRANPRDPLSDVYAVGDVATVGVPKAGVFSEGQGASSPRRSSRGGADRAACGVRRARCVLRRVRGGPRRPRRCRLSPGRSR